MYGLAHISRDGRSCSRRAFGNQNDVPLGNDACCTLEPGRVVPTTSTAATTAWYAEGTAAACWPRLCCPRRKPKSALASAVRKPSVLRHGRGLPALRPAGQRQPRVGQSVGRHAVPARSQTKPGAKPNQRQPEAKPSQPEANQKSQPGILPNRISRGHYFAAT